MKLLFLLLVDVLMIFKLNGQVRNDIIIHEIMADPSPQVGLPNYEWVEIYNRSHTPVNLQSWRFADESGQSGPFPHIIIQPDSFVVICSNNAVASLSNHGRIVGVASFPGLDNDGELLHLKNAQGQTMHAVNYNNSWYDNALKKEGGWSLEMIDPNYPCTGINNWGASTNISGGSPGARNAINAVNADNDYPHLLNTFLSDSTEIQLEFDETLDSFSAATISNYSFEAHLNLSSVECMGPLFNQVRLKLVDTLESNRIYHLSINNVRDCSQNVLVNTRTRIGKPVHPLPHDIVINEVLFDPRPNAHDYLEIYNNSDKIFDLSALFVANKINGSIGSIKNISPGKRYFYPGDYLVMTEDVQNLSLQYLLKDQHAAIELSSLPSFPDEAGHAVLLDSYGQVIDELAYQDDWHFKLISDDEGVALERIDPSRQTQSERNWHSAASSAGFGTPGYVNSQFRQSTSTAATISIEPSIISPDNDGRDDLGFIRYQLSEPGYVANIYLFDEAGHLIRRLVSNSIMGSSGYWTWDGLDENGKALPVGIYILFTEIFNLGGKKERFKNSIVVARPFK